MRDPLERFAIESRTATVWTCVRMEVWTIFSNPLVGPPVVFVELKPGSFWALEPVSGPFH